jgi:hypothetical protein
VAASGIILYSKYLRRTTVVCPLFGNFYVFCATLFSNLRELCIVTHERTTQFTNRGQDRMDSPARRYMLEGLVDSDSEVSSTHPNWEGLITALGISALGWAGLALVIVWLLR